MAVIFMYDFRSEVYLLTSLQLLEFGFATFHSPYLAFSRKKGTKIFVFENVMQKGIRIPFVFGGFKIESRIFGKVLSKP